MKKDKCYSITIGSQQWLVLSKDKPIVKLEKDICGLKVNKIIINEMVETFPRNIKVKDFKWATKNI